MHPSMNWTLTEYRQKLAKEPITEVRVMRVEEGLFHAIAYFKDGRTCTVYGYSSAIDAVSALLFRIAEVSGK